MWFNLLIIGLFSLLTDAANTSCRPHIVVILADDVGWNDVSYHGSDQIPTRNIDALAYNGVILNQHYVQPLCTPTRAALLTGRYPSNIGMQGIPIWGSERRALPPGKLMPQYLKNLGYTSRMVGKWHLGFYKKEFTPIYRGFDSHMGNWNGVTSYYEHIYQDLIPVLNTTKGDEDKCSRGSIDWNGGQLSGVDFFRDLEVALDLSGRYVTDVYTEEAVNIIKTHNKSTPLFLYLAHVACHAGNAGKLLEAPQHVIDKFSHIIEPNRRTYAAMMWKLDESVGKVVTALQKSGMLDNTIIVFLSDNGAPTLPVGVWRNWGSNYPLRGVKSVYWEGGMRSVGVLWSSRLKNTPRVSMQLMHVTDWLPTLYVAAGGSLEDLEGAQLDGVNQWDALVTDGPSNRSQVLLQLDDSRCVGGVRRDNWKLITGSNYNGIFDGYSGDSGDTTSNPPYNVSDVLQSPAGEALARVKPPPPVDSILQLRERATVTCPKLTNTIPCDPLVDKSCLFDLSADPCETNNLATTHTDKVQELTALLDSYQATMVPQLNKVYYVDQANPARFNNVWTPWDD